MKLTNHCYRITSKTSVNAVRVLMVIDATGEAHADATVQDYIRTCLAGRCWDWNVQPVPVIAHTGELVRLPAIAIV